MKNFNELIRDRLIEIGNGTDEEVASNYVELRFWLALKDTSNIIGQPDDLYKELKVLEAITMQLSKYQKIN